MHIVIAGQSNAVGGANVGTVTLETGYGSAYAAVTLDYQLALSANDPPSWLYYNGSLYPRGGTSMGVELALGRTLGAAAHIDKFAVSGTSMANHWLPTATYPTVGDNLYTDFIDYVQAREAATGTLTTAVIWIQGNGDTGQLSRANAYGENLATLVTQIRTDLGRDVVFAFDQLSPFHDGTYLSVVRKEQAQFAFDWKDRGVVMVTTDDLALIDTDHYTGDSFVTLGKRFAYALYDYVGSGAIDMTTTLALIRTSHLARLQAIVPSARTDVLFRAHREEVPLLEWAQAHPAACWRRFSLLADSDYDIVGTTAGDIETYTQGLTLLVAYPADWGKYGAGNAGSLDEAIDADIEQLDGAIGRRGYVNYPAGLALSELQGTSIDKAEGVWILRMDYLVQYDRSV